MKLADIHTKYDTDKGTGHSYIDTYDRLFAPHQHQPINFLEIGCLTCGSLKMFNDFFSKATVYGIDNWSQITDHVGVPFIHKGIDLHQVVNDIKQNYPRVVLKTCDSTNKQQVDAELGNIKFQLIIDDGDHSAPAQYQTFVNFIDLVDSRGVYIVEDVGDWNNLDQKIRYYLRSNKIKATTQLLEFHKDGRLDDVLYIVTKE